MARSTSLVMMITYIIYFLGGSDMSSKVRCKSLTKTSIPLARVLKVDYVVDCFGAMSEPHWSVAAVAANAATDTGQVASGKLQVCVAKNFHGHSRLPKCFCYSYFLLFFFAFSCFLHINCWRF